MEGIQKRLGDALADRYRIEGEVGRGATATVYLARDLVHDRPVAVKVLNSELVQAVGGQRFLREIRLAAGLQHPHLLAIHDSGEAAGVFFYVTPYLPDGSLRQRLVTERQLSVEESVGIARDVGEALAHIHAEGVVHRDVKPENILFTGSHACLADFGIARAVSASETGTDTLTSTGLVVGTPTYMSPEQASGERAMDARSDQYSLACVLYEMIAGVPPFIGATTQAVIAQRFAHAAPLLSFYRPNVRAGVNDAVARALSLAPSDRFPSVASFVAALEAGLSTGAAATARDVHDRRIKRRWFAAGAGAVAALLAALGFGPAYDRVRASFRPTVDTTRYVVLPFASTVRDSAFTGEAVADAMYAALRRWKGLPLVSDVTVTDAMGGRRAKILSQSGALDAATELGAGRLVWGRVGREGGNVVVRAEVYDVAARQSIRDGTVALGVESLGDHIVSLANDLLRAPEAPSAAAYADAATNNFNAWQAFGRGQAALAEWDLPRAERELSAAVAADPGFVPAELWKAQLAAWTLRDNPGLWRDAAIRIGARLGEVSTRDSVLGAALGAMAAGRYPEACTLYDRLTRGSPRDAVAWFGAGECRDADHAVIPSRATRSGWAFRSSPHSAAEAFRNAIDADPRATALPIYARLQTILKTQVRERRSGFDLAAPRRGFAAFAELHGDSLLFVPYTLEDVSRGREGDARLRSAAIQRNLGILLEFVLTWVARTPRSVDALEALADVRERAYQIDDVVPAGPSAVNAVRSARALAASPERRLGLEAREVRLLLKRGEFEAASSLADSVLARWTRPDSAVASVLKGLAALTGRVSGAARFAALASAGKRVGGVMVPTAVAAAAAEVDAHAALGACSGLTDRLRELKATIERNIEAERRADFEGEFLARPAAMAMPCTGGASLAGMPRMPSRISSAHDAFARGDRRNVLAKLDSVAAAAPGLRGGDVSPDFTFQEAWLRAAVGDTSGAIAQLDQVLKALPLVSVRVLDRVVEAAALPRAMGLRARLAAGTGDVRAAKYWARGVLSLWKRSDAELRPETEEMKRIVRMRD